MVPRFQIADRHIPSPHGRRVAWPLTCHSGECGPNSADCPVGGLTQVSLSAGRPLGIGLHNHFAGTDGRATVRPIQGHLIKAAASGDVDSARAWVARWVTKEATMADTTNSMTNTTTVHTVEVVRYDDPVIISERVAVAAFIAGYADPTRRSYATDLRVFAIWCHDHGFNLLNVKRPHLETFARRMEQEGLMPSTIARRLSTLS